MANTNKHKIKPCPCCNGRIEWIEIKTQDIQLWQLACEQCGLATVVDEKKMVCLQRWNKRVSDDKAKIGWIVTTLFSLFAMTGIFILGLVLGADIGR